MALRALRRLSRGETTASFSSTWQNIKSFPPLQSKLEVERKFTPTAYLERQLDNVAVWEPQPLESMAESEPQPCKVEIDDLTLTRHPDQTIYDRYFDLSDAIANRGIWVRRRNQRTFDSVSKRERETTTWEIKESVGGDFTNSAMVESEGRDKVSELWWKHFSRELDVAQDISAELCTHRRIWTAQDSNDATMQYHIVVDHITPTTPVAYIIGTETFKHSVGKVELMRFIKGGTGGREHNLARQQAIEDMGGSITTFMERHPRLFQTTPMPVGKLSAYFAWKRAHCWEGRA